ncbi:hypothetical protein QN277_005707 [Acacia crassicarpa]|uniref:F-box domain-containing protein n=1 Tax=Acacia crassicarpa TaxID=499986 RepID=A0AAE1IYJ9_9FABA|nr:hypothetical protein QN277_005707 [Acacia crassicarpa]
MATRGENPSLPPEMIINILKRLPVKSLLRLQSVCKDWKNLFKTPYFIDEHYYHSAHKNPLLISFLLAGNPRSSSLCLLRHEMKSVEVERIPAMGSLKHACGIIGSSNGLVCVILGYDHNEGSPPSLLLLNPSTREVRQLPRPTVNDGTYMFWGWGFGFSPIVKDYKIVTIHQFYLMNNSQINLHNIWVCGVEVYSFRTGSWKVLEFDIIKSVRFQSKPVTVNGTIFWLGLQCEDEDHPHVMIVSFDLSREVFKLIPLPSLTSNTHTYANMLGVYESKLAMLHCYISHICDTSIDIWVLEEGSGAYGKIWYWTKKDCIGPTSRWLYPICFWRNEIVCQNISTMCWEDDPAYNVYNLTTNNDLKKFHISESTEKMNGIFNYVESLVPVCGT